jgi:hypothetical protein
MRAPQRDPVGLYSSTSTLADEAAVLARFAGDKDLRPTPDMTYNPSRRRRGLERPAPGGDRRRPVRAVRRADPRADGLPADHPRSRQGGPRADQGYLGPVAPGRAQPGFERPVRRGRRGHLLRRQALLPDQGSALPRPQGAGGVREGRRARGHPDRGAPAYRHLPPRHDGREHAADDRGARRRISLGKRVDDIELDTCPTASQPAWAASPRSCRNKGSFIEADHVVLAVGHSARPTFEMLHRRGVHIEAKPFSIGVRIEHPQSWIDRARFGKCAGHPDLGAAAYSLAHHCANGRTVYSFCMCPGGRVVAATSEEGRVVTNGMSQYSRAEFNANSGLVVGDRSRARLSGRAAGGHRAPAPLGRAGLCRRRLQLSRAGAEGRRPARRPRLDRTRRSDPVVQARREDDRPVRMPARLRDRGVARGAAGVRSPDRQLRSPRRVMTGVETRTSSPMRITRGRTFRASTSSGCSRPAKARAMPAASSRRRSTGSRSPRRWRGA